MRNLFLITLMLLQFPVMSQAQELTILTEEYPPYNTMENGMLTGINTEIMGKVLALSGLNLGREDIQLVPWPRAYKLLLNKPGVCVYSTTRTPEREKLFAWIGPLSETEIVLTVKKGSGIKIVSPSDVADYRIGVIRDDVGHQLCLSKGIPESNLEISHNPRSLIRKLAFGHIDALVYEPQATRIMAQKMGLSPDDFEGHYVFEKSELYLACNPETSSTIIDKLKKGMEAARD